MENNGNQGDGGGRRPVDEENALGDDDDGIAINGRGRQQKEMRNGGTAAAVNSGLEVNLDLHININSSDNYPVAMVDAVTREEGKNREGKFV